jgi:heat shock protein HtpX
MNQKTWMVQRAVIAIGLLVGFYALGIGIAMGLFWLPYAEWTYAGRIHLKLLALCVGCGGAILWALVPRADRFEPPGPALEKSAHPDLFLLIEDVAARTQQAMPAEVYLLHEVNAWVTHRGGVMGVGSRRVMGIGLPLLQALSVPELKAVLAHEFGHYHSGDVALGPWLYKTRAAIGRTVSGVRDTWFEALFLWYGRLFLKVTHGVSRQQEFIADAIAADLYGRDAMANALRRTAALGPVFNSYVGNEVLPVLRAGFLPPIATGFETYLLDEHVATTSERILSGAESETHTDPFDTHPPLRERLNALAALETSRTQTGAPAVNLIGHPDRLGVALVEHALRSQPDVKLTPITWKQVGELVYAANWRDATKQHADWLGRFTADSLPAGKEAFLSAASELGNPDEGDVDSVQQVARATYLFGAAIGALLIDRGWHADTSPGKPIILSSNDAAVEPFKAVMAMADGTMTMEHWKQQCGALGIAGQQLGHRES